MDQQGRMMDGAWRYTYMAFITFNGWFNTSQTCYNPYSNGAVSNRQHGTVQSLHSPPLSCIPDTHTHILSSSRPVRATVHCCKPRRHLPTYTAENTNFKNFQLNSLMSSSGYDVSGHKGLTTSSLVQVKYAILETVEPSLKLIYQTRRGQAGVNKVRLRTNPNGGTGIVNRNFLQYINISD
jgi:hypothetical protein